MFGPKSRFPFILALVGAILGLIFASYSSFDYANHLDRRLHDVHCSFIPGVPATEGGDACRAAMYSPYSAFFKDAYWGGIPISLFAIGAFAFFAGFAAYLAALGPRAPRKAVQFFAGVSVTPSLVSMLMLFLSATKVGAFCKTCIGIYISSALVTTGGLLGLMTLKEALYTSPLPPDSPYAAKVPKPAGSLRPDITWLLPLAWLAALGLFTLVPAIVYASGVPDQRPYLSKCGTLKVQPGPQHGLIHISSARATQPVTLFEDPLCPTCKAFHQRLIVEDIFPHLDVQLAMFPLDNTCNWMLDSALHPGACTVAKAVLCGGERALQVLEWAYDKQEYLTRAGKAGEPTLRAVIQQQWGSEILTCVDDKKTAARLNTHLHFAADNNVPVSTPQVYLNHKLRFCDEDTDIGLRYTFAQLAPEVLR